MWFSLSLDGRAKLNSSDTSESYGSPHGRDNTLFLFVSMSHYFTMFISIFIHLSLYPSQCPFRPAGALYSVPSFFVKNLFFFILFRMSYVTWQIVGRSFYSFRISLQFVVYFHFPIACALQISYLFAAPCPFIESSLYFVCVPPLYLSFQVGIGSLNCSSGLL